jgi:hypothetical protein
VWQQEAVEERVLTISIPLHLQYKPESIVLQ